MTEEATVDAYGEDEQAMGFHAVIVDNVKVPFTTSVLGVEVTVEEIDLAGDNSILAVCARGGFRQAIRVVDLPLPKPPPAGAEWIEPTGTGWAEWHGKGTESCPPQIQGWVGARKRYHLSHAQVQMARELGLNPRKLGKLANHRQEPWKAPLPQFIEHIYVKRLGGNGLRPSRQPRTGPGQPPRRRRREGSSPSAPAVISEFRLS
jgi:hypothetical protein